MFRCLIYSGLCGAELPGAATYRQHRFKRTCQERVRGTCACVSLTLLPKGQGSGECRFSGYLKRLWVAHPHARSPG